MENKVLCPEDTIRVLLPAHTIPDGATVQRRTGDYQYVLKHNIVVYPVPKTEAKSLQIEGFFVCSDRIGINQVAPDTLLLWCVDAETFVDTLKESWEPIPQ